MSALEIPAFAVGLSGLIAVFEKGFEVWRVIAKASDFGDDVADWMCKLEMEFFRFQTWWTALEHLSIKKNIFQSPLGVPQPTSTLQTTLDQSFGTPVIHAANGVLKQLQKIEDVLQRNGVLAITRAQPPNPTENRDFNDEMDKSRQRLKQFAKDLMKHTAWTTQVKHGTKPWSVDSDKTILDTSLQDIIYWNKTLYSILPQSLKDNILEFGIAGYALSSPENIQDIARLSNDRDMSLSQSAKLMALHQHFEDGALNDRHLENMLANMEMKPVNFQDLNTGKTSNRCQYSIDHYNSAEGQRTRVMIEWIPFPQGDYDTHKLARRRMSQISYSLQRIEQLSPFQALEPFGFVEHAKIKCFGLVSTVPSILSSSKTVVVLHDMLPGSHRLGTTALPTEQQAQYQLPTLNQRLHIASKLAMGFYTFLLTRWHHERFSSLHIAFLVDTALSHGRPAGNMPLDLGLPIIGGFAISRPDSPTELSISVPVEDSEAVYLHPEIRQTLKTESAQQPGVERRKRFQRSHDIYAFGLLLVEIGLWRSIARVAESGSGRRDKANSLSPHDFKNAVIKKCESDLGFWAGETYRDVTIKCLKAGDPGGIQVDNSSQGLIDFYWKISIMLVD
ncbi:hypothetical protein ACHAPA_010522 [Fusarium lateritium]